MAGPNKQDPAKKLEGYDPAQRAEILETESVNVEGNDLIKELTPDRGQSITSPVPPEEQLHDSKNRDVRAGENDFTDAAADTPEGGPDAQSTSERLKKGEIDVGMDKDNDLSVLGVSEKDLKKTSGNKS